MDKKKILIDLDVVTVAIWDKKGKNVYMAVDFINKVKNKEFYVITPFFLLELVSKWKHTQLKDYIEEFYLKFTDLMLTNEDVDKKIDSMNVDDKNIITELMNLGVKGEDAFLVLVTSIFDVDYLITFNRIHLKNKRVIINEVLKKNGIRTININGPEEA